jgi:hypothetical protein
MSKAKELQEKAEMFERRAESALDWSVDRTQML